MEKDLTPLIAELRARLPQLAILEREPLSEHCSFHIGGPCAALVQPSSAEELAGVCELLRERGEEPLVIGNGTNLLITDGYLPRIVLQLGAAFSRCERLEGSDIRAQAGVGLYKLANFAAAESLAGLEFAQGIPGTLGGAVSMNAGAYGGEMKDVVASVRWLDGDGRIRESGELDFSYRHSRFSGTDDVILDATLRLREGDGEAIRQTMRELMQRRRASQPLDLPSAGSTFKRPAGGYAAALIDQAGLKGLRVGGAQVSEKHAGFVVNTGGASFSDVLRLMEEIRERVYAASGITLEPEVKIIEK